ncbi:MarR family transcriptional regulator [Amycolatopsis acidiphila]|uniref:MarR family transcriptional regulator n=2 Tax=Amycolatopsis acidiphila TaxID=715473 RepID=A0A558AFI1_9PSEU|nr:MarR family transcriptional regulator [Amycolatopsis acidiphila]
MISIGDSTLERVTGQLTLTQFRALRIVVGQTPVTMGKVAQELRMNPSSVSRACDRLARLDLLQRAQNPLNKRETLLAPTPRGRQIVDRVDHDRRAVLSAVLDQLEPAARESVVAALKQFAAAAATVAPIMQDANN